MNTNGLHKHYDKLNARERFALLATARMRNDTGEVQALARSGPRISYSMPDYTPFAESWQLLEMAYIADQMYECAAFWQAFYLATRHDDLDRMPDLLFALAYRTVVHFDGWARFCEATQIPAPGHVQSYGGWSFIVDTVETARTLAFTDEQMRDWAAAAHEIDPEDLCPPSAGHKAAQYAEAYTTLLREWGKVA